MVATVNASTSAGVVITPDNSGVLAFQSSSATALTIDASQNSTFVGTASATKLIPTGSSVTGNGLYLPAANSLGLSTNGTNAVYIDSSQNVGIGTTTPTATGGYDKAIDLVGGSSGAGLYIRGATNPSTVYASIQYDNSANRTNINAVGTSNFLRFVTVNAERMRIDSSGNLLFATTSSDVADANGTGASFSVAGNAQFSRASGGVVNINRKTDDGVLVYLQQDASAEGTISVSGTTVSYNGGHLARYAQTTIAKDESLVKGTVLSNLDAMNVYTDAEGNPVDNEQLNKVKVSDVEGDANVAGVFVNWDYDEAHQVDEINMAMTGDMIIRIAQGVTVQRGDLLMSAGDGTAKAQGDDIVRSKTIAKVTSNHVTCTYADGSYCVPCVLMAC